MSRNSEDGCQLYEKLFNSNVEIEFLKEPYINTEVYRKTIDNQIEINLNTGNKATDDLMNTIIQALNQFSLDLAKGQIKKVFDQAQKELEDLHQRTSERNVDSQVEWKKNRNAKGNKANY